MSISGLALSRVSHQAFGALETAYVCVFMCVCAFYVIPLNFSRSPSISVTHTQTQTHTRACPEGAGL